jgi:MFS family permease
MDRLQSRLPFHYGWVIVLVGILAVFSYLGLARFAFGVLLPAMSADLALSYDQMGYLSTGNFAGYLLAVALAPVLIRLYRPRSVIAGALLLIAVCMLGISWSDRFASVLAFYFLVGVGSGFANIPVMMLASHWFRRERRGRAAGLIAGGSGFGIIFSGFLIPRMNMALGPEGWRAGWLVLGLITLACAVAAAALVRNKPADLGLEPVGRKVPLAAAAIVPKDPPQGARILIGLGVLYMIFGATYMVYGTFIVTTMVVEFGFPEAKAGMFWSWVGIFSLFSGVLFGTISDRIGRKRGLMAVFAVQTAAYLLAGSSLGTAALLLSVFLYGMAVFAIPAIMAVAVGDYLGLSRAAAAFSTVTFFFAVGQTIGPGAAGILAEATGTFTTSFLIAAALTGFAVILSGFLPKPPE